MNSTMVVTTVPTLALMSVSELRALLVASRGVKQGPTFVLPGMARAFAAIVESRKSL